MPLHVLYILGTELGSRERGNYNRSVGGRYGVMFYVCYAGALCEEKA